MSGGVLRLYLPFAMGYWTGLKCLNVGVKAQTHLNPNIKLSQAIFWFKGEQGNSCFLSSASISLWEHALSLPIRQDACSRIAQNMESEISQPNFTCLEIQENRKSIASLSLWTELSSFEYWKRLHIRSFQWNASGWISELWFLKVCAFTDLNNMICTIWV